MYRFTHITRVTLCEALQSYTITQGGMDMTTVRVSEETWQDLNQRKEAGDTFDDVISRLIETRDDGGER
jgi:hypothetical protein